MGIAVVGTLVSGDTVSPDKLIFVDTGAETAQLEGTSLIDSGQEVLTNDVNPSIGTNYLPGFNLEGAPTIIHTEDSTLTLDISSTYLTSHGDYSKNNQVQNKQFAHLMNRFFDELKLAGINLTDEQKDNMRDEVHRNIPRYGVNIGQDALENLIYDLFGHMLPGE